MMMPDYNVQLAERAAAIADYLANGDMKLGNEGWCLHYNMVAQLAIDSFKRFPVDFDWGKHMDDGGDCWDIEMQDLAQTAIEQDA